MILFIVRIIKELKESQQERFKTYTKIATRTARKEDKFMFEEAIMKDICIAMDNYFTLPSVMPLLRSFGIGTFGTSRFKPNWPTARLKEIDKKDANFNTFYHHIDKHGTLVARWMDNGLVFVVSTIHRPGYVIKKVRKRPRKTILNKKHVDLVWGSNGKKEISIPTLINDYNNKMGGVDLVDQRIAYYQPDLRCQ